MPAAPPRYCSRPGCHEYATAARHRCETHQQAWKKRESREHRERLGSARERGYDSTWEKLSRMKLSADPLCERCRKHGRTTPADLVHHIVPIQEDPSLRLTWSNLKSVCHGCHGLEHSGSEA